MTPQIEKKYTLNRFDPAANSNKVWTGIAYKDGKFEARFGRVRDEANLVTKSKSFSSAAAAVAELERKRNEKLRKGYLDSKTIEAGETVVVSAPKTDLKQLATEQIVGGSGCAVTRELVEYLAAVNIHNITTATGIKYNAGNATLSTPLGVLTPQAVGEARLLLNQISGLNQSGLSGRTREITVKDYFQLVPKDFGKKIPPVSELLATAREIQNQAAILDALEAALISDKGADAGKVFECKLVKVPGSTEEGRATFRRVNELFKTTRNAHHAGTATRRMIRLYEVEIPAMKSAFDAASAKLGNVRNDLWHGTRASNLLSILKGGLIIPPSSAAQCTGRMFGNGVYTSLQSTKALNYATEMWNRSGSSSQRTFMFLCEAALGKTYKPPRTFSNQPPAGFDSAWIEAGTAGVMNHECVVYSTAQINLKYLCEFE